MKPIFYECTHYSSGAKMLLNLAMAQCVQPSKYQTANAIVTFLPTPTEEMTYYVKETYEELKAAIDVALKE